MLLKNQILEGLSDAEGSRAHIWPEAQEVVSHALSGGEHALGKGQFPGGKSKSPQPWRLGRYT